MDWQTLIVFCAVSLAAAFLGVRGWRVARRQRAKCQSSCGGCAGDEVVQLEGKAGNAKPARRASEGFDARR